MLPAPFGSGSSCDRPSPRKHSNLRRHVSEKSWGFEMPGGAEALVHWRDTIECLALRGDIAPLVACMLCGIEWPEIRAAACKHFD